MKPKFVLELFVGFFVAFGLLYVSRISSQFESFVFLGPPLLAAIMGMYTARTYQLKNIHGKSAAFIGGGLALFFVGELLFFLYQYVFHTDPFPSPADVFYLTAYPLILAGLLIEVRVHKPHFNEFSKSSIALMLPIVLALTAVVSYFGIYKVYDDSSSALANFIGMSYGIADLFILVPTLYVLKLALQFRGGKLFNSWMFIFFAMLFMLGGDILFASYNDQYSQAEWPYTLIDLLWTASYLLFAYSFYYTASVLKELRNKLAGLAKPNS